MGIVVLGAVFVDIKGYPSDVYIPGGRNAGRVEPVHGGVSRNLAEDIANVELRPTFISLVDNTSIGADVIRKLQDHKVNTDYIRAVPDGMGTWLAVFDNGGDVVASISKRPDLRPILDTLDEHGDEIFRDADSIALEIDCDKEIVKKVFYLAEKYGKPVFAAVSNMSIAVELLPLLCVQPAGGRDPLFRGLYRQNAGGAAGYSGAPHSGGGNFPDGRHHGRAGRRLCHP